MAVVHRTYARALFEAAKENGRLAEVREEFGDFVATVDEVPQLDALLRDPQLDSRAKANAVAGLVEGGEEQFRNFLVLTVEKKRGAQLREIHREFERLVAEDERRLTVELTTAYELSDEEAQQILAKIEQASGRPVDATRTVDPELIGGIVLQAGSMRVDASVRGRLERLRTQLTTAR